MLQMVACKAAAKRDIVSYVEPLSEARTKPMIIFSILENRHAA